MGVDFVPVLFCLMGILATMLESNAAATGSNHKDILMRGAKPEQPDAYLCTSYKVTEKELYVVKFEALANADTAHHILMYGCGGDAYSTKNIWGCPPICAGDQQQIMFAWAKNAPPTQLPDGVGFRIGQKTSIKTIVLQIHYAKAFQGSENPDHSGIRLHTTAERQPNVAGIFLMMSYNFNVPPNKPRYHVDMSCVYRKGYDMFPFAYRTHAHGLGRVISGYQYNETGYHMIGKGNPQWPQAFYPSNTSVAVKTGDKLVARCTYNSTGMDHTVYVGATGSDEMCNFYIMFYTDSGVQDPSGQCGGVQVESVVENMPPDADVTLPPNPLLDEAAHHHHHHSSMAHSPLPPTGPQLPLSRTTGFTATEPKPSLETLRYVANWPLKKDVQIGQVGGVATDKDGNVYIFHRGDRTWDRQSFDANNNFQHQQAPIDQDVLVIYSRNGTLLRSFGKGKFFMPHGIAVDDKRNIWLTDVALHQVFRIPFDGTEPDLTLGERFVHKEDGTHFCKPSDISILSSGEFFVSDGYCHNRIMKYSKDGTLLKQWGSSSLVANMLGREADVAEFNVPHSLSVAEDKGLVFVADRENGRVQCFDLNGTFHYSIHYPQFGSRLFAVEYCPLHGGLLFAVNGPTFDDRNRVTVKGFTIKVGNSSHQLLETWNLPIEKGLRNPHDVAVDVGGRAVYVGELNPPKVWKFQRGDGGFPTPTKITTDNDDHAVAVANRPAAGRGEDGDQLAIAGRIEGVREEGGSDLTPSLIIGVLLVIPVVLLLVITLVMRSQGSGWGGCWSSVRSPKLKGLHNLLGNSHKGFDKLSQEDSDHDADVLSDSDNEEFRQPVKTKA